MSKAEVKTVIINSLLCPLDELLQGVGFKRFAKSLNYIRKNGDFKTTLNFDFSLNPSYSKEAIVHIHPSVHISSTSLYEKSLSLVDGKDILLGGYKDLLLNMPIDFCASKDEWVYWFIEDLSCVKATFTALKSFVKSFVLPFLQDYHDVDSLLNGYKNSDQRPFYQPLIWNIHLISAFIMNAELDKADEILSTNYGKAGQLKKYESLHKNIKLLNSHLRGGNPSDVITNNKDCP